MIGMALEGTLNLQAKRLADRLYDSDFIHILGLETSHEQEAMSNEIWSTFSIIPIGSDLSDATIAFSHITHSFLPNSDLKYFSSSR